MAESYKPRQAERTRRRAYTRSGGPRSPPIDGSTNDVQLHLHLWSVRARVRYRQAPVEWLDVDCRGLELEALAAEMAAPAPQGGNSPNPCMSLQSRPTSGASGRGGEDALAGARCPVSRFLGLLAGRGVSALEGGRWSKSSFGNSHPNASYRRLVGKISADAGHWMNRLCFVVGVQRECVCSTESSYSERRWAGQVFLLFSRKTCWFCNTHFFFLPLPTPRGPLGRFVIRLPIHRANTNQQCQPVSTRLHYVTTD